MSRVCVTSIFTPHISRSLFFILALLVGSPSSLRTISGHHNTRNCLVSKKRCWGTWSYILEEDYWSPRHDKHFTLAVQEESQVKGKDFPFPHSLALKYEECIRILPWTLQTQNQPIYKLNWSDLHMSRGPQQTKDKIQDVYLHIIQHFGVASCLMMGPVWPPKRCIICEE